MEFSSHQISALICSSCRKDLTKAITFRKLCLESDNFFKKSLHDIETTVWSEKYKKIISGQEATNEEHQIIKMEPNDLAYATIFEDNSHVYEDSYDYVGKYEDEAPSETVVNESPASSSTRKPKQRKRQRKVSVESDEFKDSEYEVTRNARGVAECKFCSKTFTKAHSLKCHIKAVHRKVDETEMHKCEECGKLFKLKYYLRELKMIFSHSHFKKNIFLIFQRNI
jgi:ribosomal protein L37AE/L43A